MTPKERALSICAITTLVTVILVIISIKSNKGDPQVVKDPSPYKPNAEVHTCKNLLWDEEVFDQGLPVEEDWNYFDVSRWIESSKYTTEKYGCYGDCDFNAIYNVMALAGFKLWAEVKDEHTGDTYHAPCGGKAMCRKPYLAENVVCYVEETDCNFGEETGKYQDPKVLQTYLLDCRGDRICVGGAAEDCCIVTKTIKGPVQDLEDES